MNPKIKTKGRGAARRRVAPRIVRLGLVLAAPLALLDLQCRTDFRDAVVGGGYDFVTAKTFEALEQAFALVFGGADNGGA